ncbi:MAG: glutathione S-transferase family protein [Pseudomonadota bacterium]
MSYRLHYAPDNASLITRLALEELEVPYDTLLVDRSLKAHRSADYRQLNPAGRIPTLETPDGPISETGAILIWLADRHGGLLPALYDPLRGAALNWLLFVANTLHPEMIQTFYIHRYGPKAAWDEMRLALHGRIHGHLEMLETQAIDRCGPWFCGPAPSAIDLYLAGVVRWLGLYGFGDRVWVDHDALPRIMDMCARLETRASCKALILAEGMSDHPFTAPERPNPPEGTPF